LKVNIAFCYILFIFNSDLMLIFKTNKDSFLLLATQFGRKRL